MSSDPWSAAIAAGVSPTSDPPSDTPEETEVADHVAPAPSRTPVPKVAAAGTAGSASVVLVWLAARLGLEMPAEVAASIVGLAMFAAGYLKRG